MFENNIEPSDARYCRCRPSDDLTSYSLICCQVSPRCEKCVGHRDMTPRFIQAEACYRASTELDLRGYWRKRSRYYYYVSLDELWFFRILKELKQHLVTAKNRDEAVSYVSHPLNAYQLIKRGHNGIMPCSIPPYTKVRSRLILVL